MTLSPKLLQHKTLMIAILYVARQIAAALEVSLDASIAEICRNLDANRPSIYEQAQRIQQALGHLAEARPGRPSAAQPLQPPQHLFELTIDVLEFRLQHPGSVCKLRHRTTYAPAFQRFILKRHDQLQDCTLEGFARAVRIPLDTLRDWLRRDHEILVPEAKQRPPILVEASLTTCEIVDEWLGWVGPLRPFLTYAAEIFGVSTAQIAKLFKILGITSTHKKKTFRYRGSTQTLAPATILVTDGKWLTVKLPKDVTIYFNWQAMVDQTTGCHTAALVTEQEDAKAVKAAFETSVRFLGGKTPLALLHDNRPCYQDAEMRDAIESQGARLIPATPFRPENKAILEGAFGLWQQRIGRHPPRRYQHPHPTTKRCQRDPPRLHHHPQFRAMPGARGQEPTPGASAGLPH